jgi:DNA modification methylase
MIEAGWILRNDIVWNKPNPMPESVKDRFTGSWEHLFFFSKSKHYFFEQQFEPNTTLDGMGWAANGKGKRYSTSDYGQHLGAADFSREGDGLQAMGSSGLGRNKRDVWEINAQPYPEAHFATFPEKLCETPILAGCPSMICKKCAKARERIYEQTGHVNKREPAYVPNNSPTKVDSTGWAPTEKPTNKYTDCGCNAGFEPGVVLDPFCGSGTALAVAKKLGRKGIGIDLSPKYCDLTIKRLQRIPLSLGALIE